MKKVNTEFKQLKSASNFTIMLHAYNAVLECNGGFYGNECNMTCEHCNKTSPDCLQINGSCLYGCESIHWEGEKCDGS